MDSREYHSLGTTPLMCFIDVIELLGLRLSRRMQLMAMRYCKHYSMTLQELVLRLDSTEFGCVHNDEAALKWLDYGLVEDKKNATDEVEEVEDLHEAVRAVIISQQRAELEHKDEDYGSKVTRLIHDHQDSLYLVMKTLPEHLSMQWVSALATVAEAEILLAAGDTDISSTAKLRDKLAEYSRWDMRLCNQGEQVFQSLFLTPVLLDGAPREVEAGPLSHQLLSPGASTSRVHTLEPPFRRSQVRQLLDDGASPLKERLAILEDLGFSYSFTNEFWDVFEVGKVFVQKQLSALEKIYEQYKTKTSYGQADLVWE